MAESPYQRAESDASRPRGPQTPQKYPRVGANYLEYGEQSGYVYNPFTDQYYIDPNAYSDWQQQSGITKPTPGLLETVAPLAGASLAMSAGQTLGSQIPGMLSGLGGSAGTASTVGATTAPTGLGTAMGASPVAGVGATGAGTAGATTGATTTAGGASGGLMGLAAPLAVGAMGANQIYEQGGKEILAGKGKSEHWAPTIGYAVSPATAPMDFVLRNLGLPTLGGMLGGLFEETTNVEDKKLQALKDQGILPEDFQIVDEERSRQQQAKDLRASGQEVSKFLDTGDVKDLTPTDIQGYAQLLERNPNDLEARLKDAQDALAAGAVREGKGTIDIDWDKVNEYRASNPATSTNFNFDPNSPEYSALSKEQKDEYWRVRNG